MKWLRVFRERLVWRLFLSHLIIVLVGIGVLDLISEMQVPAAFARDIPNLLGNDPRLANTLSASFRAAVNELLAIGTLAALFTALVMSLFTARRIVNPIQTMLHASQHIIAGDYHERVPVPTQDELGALAQSFNQMTETLEQTEQRRLELMGNVAHELRTPLTSIRSGLEGLVDGVLPAESETFLIMQREVARLQRLVNDLTELSRAESRQITLDLRAHSLADVMQNAVAPLRPQFEDKKVELRVDVPSELWVRVDAGRMTQVLLNLIGNALQYTPSGGRVDVRAWAENRQVFIAAQDTGSGIAPEHLPHVFERFYRVDKSRARAGGGSGIGLTIARYLTEAHGGQIFAASPSAGQGSTFTIVLPLG